MSKPSSRAGGAAGSAPKLPPLSTGLSTPTPQGLFSNHAAGNHGTSAATGISASIGSRGGGDTSAPGDDATFITAGRGRNEAAAFADPAAMDRVRQLHGQLTSVVSTLNDKVSNVLKKQESEFLRAYRAHMYSVQKELAQLRAKADDAALQLAKNEKIRQLEAERDWYRSEALRLDSFCSSLKTDVEYMRDKLAAVEDDRAWLERQLKTSKRSAALREADTASRAYDDSGEVGSDADEDRGSMAGSRLDDTNRPASSMTETGKPSGTGPKLSKKYAPNALHTLPAGLRNLSSLSATAPDGTDPKLTSSGVGGAQQNQLIKQLQGQVAATQKLLEAVKARNSRLKASNTALRASRGELETFFLQCVEDVRKEVARRRVRTVAASNMGTSAALPGLGGPSSTASSPGMSEAAISNSQTVDLAVALARARNATLSDFSPADRRTVVSRLLQDELVLHSLHGVIFPGTEEAIEEEGEEDRSPSPSSPNMPRPHLAVQDGHKPISQHTSKSHSRPGTEGTGRPSVRAVVMGNSVVLTPRSNRSPSPA